MYQVEILQWQQPLPVLMRPHQGPYAGIATAFASLRQLLLQHAAGAQPVRAFGQYWDAPAMVAPALLRSAACLAPPSAVSLSRAELESRGFVHGELAAGRYACIVHQGPYQGLAEAWNWLIKVWLPASGERVAPLPVLDEALNAPHNTPSAMLRTRLLLPLV